MRFRIGRATITKLPESSLETFSSLELPPQVIKAAARLKVQQPAMSHHLSTLPTLFGNDLFIKVGNYMQPTAKAQAMPRALLKYRWTMFRRAG